MWRRVFISYGHSREDDAVAYRVANLIQSAGRPVWIDRQQLRQQSGAGLNQEIEFAIRGACLVLLVQSSYSLASGYVQAENVHAMSLGVPILRVELEPCALPPALMPLVSAPTLRLHAHPPSTWDAALLDALSELGVRLRLPAQIDPVLKPTSRVIRPSYDRIRQASVSVRREILERLLLARKLYPSNGYNALSLALMRLALKDYAAALADAETAVRELPLEGEAYYTRALIGASAEPLKSMYDNRAVTLLQDLARARRLPEPGAHADVLSAIVLSEHFLANSKTPPALPEKLLEMARSKDRVLLPDELHRIVDHVPVSNPAVRAEIHRLMSGHE